MDDGFTVVGMARARPIEQNQVFAEFIEVSVDEAEVVEASVRGIVRELGPVTVCVNAAGVGAMNHFVTTPASTLDRVMRVNYLGVANTTRAVLPGMIRSRWGRVVNLSTAAVRYDLEGEAAYVASKAAVEALTRTLAHEVGRFGVTVNAIAPGPIPTALLRGVPDAAIERLVERQAVRRLGTTADVVNVLRFLLQEQSSMVTGQVIGLGGP